MSFVDKESLKQLIINIKNTFVENGDSVTAGKSTNNADNFINAESTNDEIIAAWNNNKFALAKGLGNISIGYDNLSLGDKGSLATGRQTKALNSYAFSNGLLTEATGWASVATGDRAKAFGDSSRAGGYFSEATGSYSTAEGYAVKSKGACSHSVNRETMAEGDNSFACNHSNNAKGIDSFAGGNNSTAGGAVSFVHGSNIQESGNNNSGFGANNTIKAFFSSVFGRRNKVGGNTYQGLVTGYENELNIDGSASNNTFVGGAGCKVSKANNSFVFGNYLKLMRQAWGATAFGSYNDDTSTASFVIGNGRSDTNRSNAFEVYGNGLVKTPNAIEPTDPYHLTTKKYVDSRINKDKFKIVDILPTTDIDKSLIYLVPASESDGKSYYDEYIYVSHDLPGAENIYGWELLGTTQLEVDLSDYYTKSEVNTLTNDFATYHELQALELDLDNQLSECVKNTDYATAQKAGIVCVYSGYGITQDGDHKISINPASLTDIDNKTSNYKPIVPKTLDYAVKKALSDSKLEDTANAWTDEEKAKARKLLGAVGDTYYGSQTRAGLCKGSEHFGTEVIGGSGIITVRNANEEDIDKKEQWYRPIVPANLDYAIKVGVTTNTIALTDNEKTTAQQWLGVNLIDYVKNTDYATVNKAGVVRAKAEYGIRINEDNNNGILVINSANKTDINDKSDYFKPIVPAYLEHAVKVGVTTNTVALTDEEKIAARNWFGAVGNTDYANQSVAGVVKGNAYYGTLIGSGGIISIQAATEAEIDAKQQEHKPIVPSNLAYAVKSVAYDKDEIDAKLSEVVNTVLANFTDVSEVGQ